MKSFMRQYEVERAYILTRNQANEIDFEGKQVIYKPLLLASNISP